MFIHPFALYISAFPNHPFLSVTFMLGHPNTLKLCTAQDVNSTMILENSRILRVTRLVFSWLGYGKLQPQIQNFSQKLLVFFSSAL